MGSETAARRRRLAAHAFRVERGRRRVQGPSRVKELTRYGP